MFRGLGKTAPARVPAPLNSAVGPKGGYSSYITDAAEVNWNAVAAQNEALSGET
jgi:hypothetical protein